MPTVCASLPVHAPTTTIFLPRALMRDSISSRERAPVRTSGTSICVSSTVCDEWP